MLGYLPKGSVWILIAMVAVLTLGLMVALSGVAQGAHSTAVSKVYWTDRNNGTLSESDLHTGVTNVLVQNFARLQDVDLDTS